MKKMRKGTRRGFSLVELLAVVLILAVLAGVAVPLYLNTRKSSAARTCLANLASIAAAESAYALRNGTYASMGQLVGAKEGLSEEPRCPLNRNKYELNPTAPTATDTLTISCPDATDHAAVFTSTDVSWSRTLRSPTEDKETLP